jgi:uncharacterized protein YbaP (TraB family)
MKPWLAAVTISMLPLAKAGLDAKAGADAGLRASAAAEGDAIEGFETPEEQVRYLADLPEGEQLAFLENVRGEGKPVRRGRVGHRSIQAFLKRKGVKLRRIH